MKPVKENQRLRFFLTTDDDFRFFHEAVTEKLKSVEWAENRTEEDLDDTEPEGQ